MKRIRIRRPRPGMILGVIAVVLAAAGTAFAAANLRLADFEPSSRDRLAGTGVIQYAAQTSTTSGANGVQQFTVQCAAAKKATAGGWRWVNVPPPPGNSYDFVGAYPIGGGFKVILDVKAAGAHNQPLALYANCVKSRRQDGTPPA
jgi:hypothetical protein